MKGANRVAVPPKSRVKARAEMIDVFRVNIEPGRMSLSTKKGEKVAG
jgi:hypothetical protein